MTNFTSCPNCSAEIKGGFFGSTEIVEPRTTELINEFTNNSSQNHCTKCSGKLLEVAKPLFIGKRKSLSDQLKDLIRFVPINTLQNPFAWEYQAIGMVTAQSVTGTGAFSEFASSVTDLFGAQSGAFNRKIKGGENICKSQLRLSAVNLGANAVIATDIDYAEVGGGKGMLMVCMAGTAVRLKNPEVLGDTYLSKFNEMDRISKELLHLSKYSFLVS